MSSEDYKQALKNYMKDTPTVEEAYSAYADLIDEKVNANVSETATYEITWGERPVSGNRIENLLKSLGQLGTKTQKSDSEPFRFKSMHQLDSPQLQELQAERERGAELESVFGLVGGVSIWMFFLSIVLTSLLSAVGSELVSTGIALTIASVLIFWGAVVGASKAPFKYLPDQFRQISADHWSIRQIDEITR